MAFETSSSLQCSSQEELIVLVQKALCLRFFHLGKKKKIENEASIFRGNLKNAITLKRHNFLLLLLHIGRRRETGEVITLCEKAKEFSEHFLKFIQITLRSCSSGSQPFPYIFKYLIKNEEMNMCWRDANTRL